MKKIVSTLLLLVNIITIYADEIQYTQINNNILLIGSKEKCIPFGNGFKSKKNLNLLSYNLELYSTEKTKQYAIQAKISPAFLVPHFLKYAYTLPTHSKILIKTFDDSVIELVSIIHNTNFADEKDIFTNAIFPITDDQLQKLFSGIKKIRIEVITTDDETEVYIKDYADLDYKKDKVGKQFQKWYDAITAECNKRTKRLSEISNKSENSIREGF